METFEDILKWVDNDFSADSPPARICAALWTLNDFGGADKTDSILPFCTNGFPNNPRTEAITIRSTPPGTSSQSLHNLAFTTLHSPSRLRTTVAQVHCAESPRPEKGYRAENVRIQEPALYGYDSNDTRPAESAKPDSYPAYTGTEGPGSRARGGFRCPGHPQ
ncbi:uncharacterized protein ACWYII_029106 isoform 2-T2 [Salvelinus alpinus]